MSARWISIVVVITLALAGAADAKKKRKRRKRMKGPEVCAQFSAEVVKEVLGDGFKEEPSSYTPLCNWTRPTPNADAAQEAYNKAMQAWTMAKVKAMQTKSEPPPMPSSPQVVTSVSVSWRGDAKSAEAAKSQLAGAKKTITEGITVSASGSTKRGFKTKTKIGGREVSDDAAEREANEVVKGATKGAPTSDREVKVTRTFQADVEDVAGLGDGAFWNPKHRSLTVVKGKRMFTVSVGKMDGKEKATAIALAKGWMK